MIFHWLTDDGKSNGTGYIKFGSNIVGLQQTGVRPDYVTIDKVEFEAYYTSEKKMLQYMRVIKRAMVRGGKIYIEATI